MFTPNRNLASPSLPTPAVGSYTVYGWDRSYFTRKLTAALTFYGASYQVQRKTPEYTEEIHVRSGTHQIPVLHTAENWMLADSTPIIQLLDGRFPDRAMFPIEELGFLVHLLESYCDEWLARTTVHWRWNYSENHELLSMDLAEGHAEIAAKFADWGSRVCRATGVSSEIQKTAAEEEYFRILTAAEAQLIKTAFLLGERPTALDCVILGGLRAHFNYDPAPKKAIESRFPTVIEWCTERADNWNGAGSLNGMSEMTDFAKFLLTEMADTFVPFSLANKEALRAKQKAFVIRMYDEDVSYLARPYVETSRQMLVAHFNKLTETQQLTLRSVLPEPAILTLLGD